MSAFESGGNAFDQSGNGRTLTYNGNPTYNYDDLVPYLDFDGTGDWMSRATEAGLDITGLESYVAPARRGLSLGLWFRPDEIRKRPLITKFAGANFSYALYMDLAGTMTFQTSPNGVAWTTVTSTNTYSTTAWNHAVGWFDPGAQIGVHLNGVTTPAVTADASIFSGNAPLNLGAFDNWAPGAVYDGRMSMAFLCASLLSDTIIRSLFHQTRAMCSR